MKTRRAQILVLTLCAGALVAGAVWISVRTGRRGLFVPPYSSYRTDEFGTRGYYLLLESLGLRVAPLNRDLSPNKDRGLLVMVNPERVPEVHPDKVRSAGQRILDWVKEGNRVLVVADRSSPVLAEWGLEIDKPPQATAFGGAPAPIAPAKDEKIAADCVAVGLRPIVLRASRLATFENRGWKFNDESWSPVYAKKDAVQVAVRREGKGEIWAVSDPFPVLNSGIGEGDNAEFLVAVASGLPEGSSVLFDEYHLGLGTDKTVWEYIRQAGLEPFCLVLVLLLGIGVWTFGKCVGRPLPERLEGQWREASEYVHGLANFYRRTFLARHLVERVFVGYRQALCARVGVVPRASDPELLAVCGRRWPKASESLTGLFRQAKRLMAHRKVHEGEVLLFLRDLAHIEEKTLHG